MEENIAVEENPSPKPLMDKPDLKYRGPLSYRWMRLLGWLFVAFSQVATIITIAQVMKVPGSESLNTFGGIASSFFSLMMPCFLLANFSLILNSKTSYKRIILLYVALTIGVALIFYLVADRYIYAIAFLVSSTKEEAYQLVNALVTSSFKGGINVFLDLLLCSLFFFFITYRPKKFFQGKNIVWFRLFALIVVAYEVTGFVLKILSAESMISLHHAFTPWLPVKPMPTFLAFVAIVAYMKIAETRYLSKGHNHEEYLEYCQTNRHSLHVSIVIAIAFAVAALLDATVYLSLVYTSGLNGEQLTAFAETVYSYGFGRGISLLLVAPLALLFSYTRTHENKQIDTFLPFIGIALVGAVYAEGLYFVLTHLS